MEKDKDFFEETLNDTIDMLYELIELESNSFTCPSGCCKCCSPVVFSKTEAKRMGITGRLHTLGKGEDGTTCEMINEETGRCSVYENRPFICRLFNATKNGPFKCEEIIECGNLTVDRSDELLQIYFNFIEAEGSIEEFIESTSTIFQLMKTREMKNGWIHKK